MIRIDEAICAKCNTCTQYCPTGIIAEGPKIREAVHKFCILCGHCVVACPSGAISVVDLGDCEVPPYAKTIPVSSQAMETFLRRRRSIRHYKKEPVSKEHLEKMIEAMNEDPSIKPLMKIPKEELVVSGFTLGYPDEEHFRYPPRRPMQTVWV